ncbi:MAG: alpha/beta hydrolase [Verrucomicrobia bacterium]|nr:alpha/beta hydrolase [Verrucomicrobiota bacterium]
MTLPHLIILSFMSLTGAVFAQNVTPTYANVPYGPHSRNVLDFWKATSDKPTPVVIFIHGGGFTSGSKSEYATESNLRPFLNAGVSCVAINYPYLVSKPIQDILRDCARAVQFVRSNAVTLKLHKTKIAAVGTSAGAGTALWLATRDDLANPNATDPVLRESSRLRCAVLYHTQATYDLTRWESFLGPAKPEFFVNATTPEQFYHFPNATYITTPAAVPILRECDMLSWISKNDAPLFLDSPIDVPALTTREEWLHSTKHARAIKTSCSNVAVPCTLVQDESTPPDLTAFFVKHLGPDGFETWAASLGISEDATSDSDGDGIQALLEYGLGYDPKKANTLPTPVANGADLKITWPKGSQAAADTRISYRVEVSNNLKDWGPPASGNLTQTANSIELVLPSTDSRSFARIAVVRD